MTARHWFAVYHAPMGTDDEPRLRAMGAGAKAALIAAIFAGSECAVKRTLEVQLRPWGIRE